MQYILSFLLLSTLLFPQEIFLQKDWLNAKGSYTLSKKYCHPGKNGTEAFCQKSELSYPNFLNAPDEKIVKKIQELVNTTLEAYNKEDLKRSVIENISDANYQPHGTWDTSNILDLFTVTENTFTMEESGSGYTGGAHGYFSVHYDNYDHDGKLLTLDDLFIEDYNTSLHQIAKKVYKNSVGLKERESLLKDGWFSDKFILTPNVAITNRGLLFHYNSYEIKPYAAGHTEFMLPYHFIHSLIAPEGPLKAYLSIPKRLQTTYIMDDVASLSLSVERIDPTHIRIDVEEKVWIYTQQSWLSLSFPGLKKRQAVKISASQGFKSTQGYSAGSKIYHTVKKKAVKSKYLLVEGETRRGDEGKNKQLSLIVTVPRESKSLRIRVRTSFKNGKKLTTMPSEWEGVKGQQGFTNYELTFPLQ